MEYMETQCEEYLGNDNNARMELNPAEVAGLVKKRLHTDVVINGGDDCRSKQIHREIVGQRC